MISVLRMVCAECFFNAEKGDNTTIGKDETFVKDTFQNKFSMLFSLTPLRWKSYNTEQFSLKQHILGFSWIYVDSI